MPEALSDALASVAKLIIPLQDARVGRASDEYTRTLSGNWRWRFPGNTQRKAKKLAAGFATRAPRRISRDSILERRLPTHAT